MKTFKNFTEYALAFSTEEDCKKHLCDEKWKDGFVCRKCQHTTSIKGKTWYFRKCQKCRYDESCTANTLFHKIKFPLTKAFWIVYQLSTQKKGMSTMEIARQYGIHQETAWFFKRKVQESMKPTGLHKLTGVVEVDEMAIGGLDKGAPGRSRGKKKLVQVATEIEYETELENPKPFLKRAYAILIKDYSAEELKNALDETVAPEAVVVTDKWPSYNKAVGERLHAPDYSKSGENFPLIHWHIFNIKNWIRGIHHKISDKHAQCYLDEYHYRFNRRNSIASCPKLVLNRLIKHPWVPYQVAIRDVER